MTALLVAIPPRFRTTWFGPWVMPLAGTSMLSALRAIFDRIMASADVFMQNVAPGAKRRAGFGSETLRSRYPNLSVSLLGGPEPLRHLTIAPYGAFGASDGSLTLIAVQSERDCAPTCLPGRRSVTTLGLAATTIGSTTAPR